MDATALPHGWPALAALAFLLGARHGFDADHLAAIDGLTRSCGPLRPRLARFAGTLFSLGHGAVVMAVALGVSRLQSSWQVPAWLEQAGAWISMLTLFALALLNGMILWRTRDDATAPSPTGWRSWAFARLLAAQTPGAMALVGALFALSFDTVSQAGLLAIAASRLDGWQPALGLALCFTLGMLAIDGFNGWVVASLIRRADGRAQVAARAMGWGLVLASGLTGLVGLVAMWAPDWGPWMDAHAWLLSLAVVACVASGFGVGWVAASRR
jgi:nickel/cobalt transporter (NiCoT) family protein